MTASITGAPTTPSLANGFATIVMVQEIAPIVVEAAGSLAHTVMLRGGILVLIVILMVIVPLGADALFAVELDVDDMMALCIYVTCPLCTYYISS